jgi:hypothetical protein
MSVRCLVSERETLTEQLYDEQDLTPELTKVLALFAECSIVTISLVEVVMLLLLLFDHATNGIVSLHCSHAYVRQSLCLLESLAICMVCLA